MNLMRKNSKIGLQFIYLQLTKIKIDKLKLIRNVFANEKRTQPQPQPQQRKFV